MHSLTRLAVVVSWAMVGQHPALAGTRRDDVADSQYLALANSDPMFDAVGALRWSEGGGGALGSGTLINDRWVLTAAHNIDGFDGAGSGINNLRFQVGGSTIAAEQWIAHPNWFAFGGEANLFSGWDIGLVQLSDTVDDIVPANLFTASDELGSIATTVGFGQTGTGLTGAQAGSAGTRRAGQNVIDVVGGTQTTGSNPAFAFGHDRILAVDFDRPGAPFESTLGSPNPLPLEYLTAPGDSGGGLFIEADGALQLAGVTSFGSTIDGLINSDYGDRGSYTRVSRFIDWITDTIAANTPVVEDADFNLDGNVDAADFLIWQRGFGSPGTLATGDANADGVVDERDFLIWEGQFGQPPLGIIAAVPEPASAMLIGLAVALLASARRMQPTPARTASEGALDNQSQSLACAAG